MIRQSYPDFWVRSAADSSELSQNKGVDPLAPANHANISMDFSFSSGSTVDLCQVTMSWWSLILGIILTLGTLISYIPQYVSIFRRKSSEGTLSS